MTNLIQSTWNAIIAQPRYRSIKQQPLKTQILWLRRMAMAENIVQGTFSRTGFNPLLDIPIGGELFDWLADRLDRQQQQRVLANKYAKRSYT